MAKAPEPVSLPTHAANRGVSFGSFTLELFSRLSNILSRCMLFGIRVYRLFLSPWLGNQCRFYPSCSHYAEEAINTHGPVHGGYLTVRRLGKCHPWHAGGCDPVPPPRS